MISSRSTTLVCYQESDSDVKKINGGLNGGLLMFISLKTSNFQLIKILKFLSRREEANYRFIHDYRKSIAV